MLETKAQGMLPFRDLVDGLLTRFQCIHNQPEMEGLKNSNDKATCKVTKPRYVTFRDLRSDFTIWDLRSK